MGRTRGDDGVAGMALGEVDQQQGEPTTARPSAALPSEDDRADPTTRWARHREVQALAYACAEAVAADLCEGMTERDAARAMARWLGERGVREWFHRPFAWFGERTAFVARPAWTPLHFFPTGRRLTEGTPVILDVAPVVDRYAADIGLATWFGDEPDPRHELMLADLEPYRALVLDGVRSGRTLARIYADVDELLADQGYRPAHRQYPFSVIAHRVADRQAKVPGPVRGRTPAGFGLGAQRFLSGQLAAAVRGAAPTPLWNGTRHADRPAPPGLWAVEPHLAWGDLGVKWEELLVVTEDDAFWLDDDLPHVRRWSTP